MNENTNIIEAPVVAESKPSTRPSHQLLAIKREISSYAGSHTHLLERVNEQSRIIAEQTRIIAEQKQTIEYLEAKNMEQNFIILDQQEEIQDLILDQK